MTEINQKCIGIGVIKDADDKVELRQLMIIRENVLYSIAVATPSHIAGLRAYNERFPNTEVQLDDTIYPLENVSTVEEVCRELSRIPLKTLAPYLTEQKEIEDKQS